MKKFIEERKRLANKHQQENSALSNIVKEEEEGLMEENNKVSLFRWLIKFFLLLTFLYYIILGR
jgi:hypothetical protein